MMKHWRGDACGGCWQTVPDCEVCGEAADGHAALRGCEQFQPDVVLMDIRMPGMDGLEAARHLAGLADPPAVIFTTAFGDHALEASDREAGQKFLYRCIFIMHTKACPIK